MRLEFTQRVGDNIGVIRDGYTVGYLNKGETGWYFKRLTDFDQFDDYDLMELHDIITQLNNRKD